MTRRRMTTWFVIPIGGMVLAAVGGCRDKDSAEQRPKANDSVIVPRPDLSGVAPDLVAEFDKRRSAVLANSDSVEAWGALGVLCDSHGLRESAVHCYQEANRLQPRVFAWAYHLAVLRDELGANEEESLKAFQDLQSLRADYPPAWIRLAQIYERTGNFASAREAYREALLVDPNALAAHRGLGQLLLAEGDVEGAADQLQQAQILDPADRGTLSALAQVLFRLGQEKRANEVAAAAFGASEKRMADPLRDGVLSLSVNPTRLYAEAKLFFDRGQYRKAIDKLRKVQRWLPDDPYAPFLEAYSWLRLGKRDEAESAFKKALSMRDGLKNSRQAHRSFTSSLWDFRVELLNTVSQSATEDVVDRILASFETAADAEPEFLTERAYTAWASTLCRRGQIDRCLALFHEAIRINPRYADGYYNIGATYESLGQPGKALPYYRQAVALEPNHAATRRLEILGD
ncbi:MAG: tetratricopeptide repeat protein [Planctomycetota bacterium]|jgi:tetratricopeptide (TPR) repeat protein